MLNKEWFCLICGNNFNYSLAGKFKHCKSKKHIKIAESSDREPKLLLKMLEAKEAKIKLYHDSFTHEIVKKVIIIN